MCEKKRVIWIDCAKGITILLVIVGHTIPIGLVSKIIYSFHIPLFFILSCITYSYSKSNDQLVRNVEKSFRHLVIPAYSIFGFYVAYMVLSNLNSFNSKEYVKTFFADKIVKMITSCGDYFYIMSNKYYGIGICWFLVALFVGRTVFDYIHMKMSDVKLFVMSSALSLLGVFFGKVQWLPWSLDISFVIMPLFYLGSHFYLINVEKKAIQKLSISLLLWAITFYPIYIYAGRVMDLNHRQYPFYPICLVNSCLGTIVIVEFSVILTRFIHFLSPLLYIGKNSLFLLLIHSIDEYFSHIWMLSNNNYINSALRILVDICLFFLVMLIVEKLKKNKTTTKGMKTYWRIK